MSRLTQFLFARPSFLEGIGRSLDLGGTMTEYNNSDTGGEADFYAVSADWRAVGMDLHYAMLELARERISKLPNLTVEDREHVATS